MVLGVLGMEVGRFVIVEVHRDRDAVEVADPGHLAIVTGAWDGPPRAACNARARVATQPAETARSSRSPTAYHRAARGRSSAGRAPRRGRRHRAAPVASRRGSRRRARAAGTGRRRRRRGSSRFLPPAARRAVATASPMSPLRYVIPGAGGSGGRWVRTKTGPEKGSRRCPAARPASAGRHRRCAGRQPSGVQPALALRRLSQKADGESDWSWFVTIIASRRVWRARDG